jgi:hypothetical protein
MYQLPAIPTHSSTSSLSIRVEDQPTPPKDTADQTGLPRRPQDASHVAGPAPRSDPPMDLAKTSAQANMRALVGPLTTEPAQVRHGLKIVVTVDSSTQDLQEKRAALNNALGQIHQRFPGAFNGLPELPVYLGKAVRCEAAWEPEQPGGMAALFLGRSMFSVNRLAGKGGAPATPEAEASTSTAPTSPFTQDTVGVWGDGKGGPRGVSDQVYDSQRKSRLNPTRMKLAAQGHYQKSKSNAKATAVVVHELGHLIHAHRSPDSFWANRIMGTPSVPVNIGGEVSNYAMRRNPDEFVAEVFTGLVYGKTYSAEVMAEYDRLGGPR